MKTAALICAAALLLAACGTPGGSAQRQTFDLGGASTPAPGADIGSLPIIAIPPVAAAEWLDSTAIVYRLAYVDALQPKRYANSQWSAPPASLLTVRLRDAYAGQAHVVSEGDTFSAPVLQVELEEFAQIFDRADQSRAVLRLRVSLVRTGKLVAQRSFFAERGASSADAAGGAHGLALLSDSVAHEIVQWSLPYLR